MWCRADAVGPLVKGSKVSTAKTAPGARPAWLLYAILLFSSGFFAFAWIVLLMIDINRIERRPVFPIGVLVAFLSLGILAYFALLLMPEAFYAVGFRSFFSYFVALFALGTALVASLVTMLVLVDRRTKLTIGDKFSAMDASIVVGLTFLLMSSFVLVQRHVNALSSLVSRTLDRSDV